MAVVTALIHLFAYTFLIGFADKPGVGFLLALMALPILALHLAIYAVARFSLVWGFVAAMLLIPAVAFAGWIWWSVRINEATITNLAAVQNAAIFCAVGFASAIALMGWLRFTRPRSG